MENIDLEEGKIKVNGKWLTEDEIRYAIKMKVSSDDYNVSDLAVALKTLMSEMNKSSILRVRVTKEMAEEFEELSKIKGESIESMLRDILNEYIGKEGWRDEKFEEEEETDSYEDIELEKPNKVYEDEDEPDEEEEEEDVGISIGVGDDYEDELTNGLLDLDTIPEESDTEEVEIEDGLVVEELPDIEIIDEDISQPEVEDIEVIDEDINQPEVEDIELEDIDSPENLEIEDIDDIEVSDEESEEPELKEFFPERKENNEDPEEEPKSDIEAASEEVEKPKGRKIKMPRRKKKATKKKVILRKKRLKNKTQ
jgi:hypothetical protein